MPDPIDQLESFDPGAPMTPLPPAEVRRLGDRHRHRRTAGVALAAAAAVVVVATGAAVLGGGREGAAPDPAPPVPSVTTTPEAPRTSEPPVEPADIPAGFPLAAAWPDEHEPGEEGLVGPGPDVEVLDGLEACGVALPAAPSTDRLAARWGNVEDHRSRLLLTFDDAEGAIDFQAQLLAPYRACPREETSDGFTTLSDVRRTAVGGESWAVVRSYEFEGSPSVGLEVLHVVRLGRALLVDTTSGEGMAATADGTLAGQTADAAEVVAAMCAFTEAGC
ncbi:hypothetical protein [Nocardioides sp. 503]|uniref:hypothetical protein n=1 Tax=Nocardioides sp. 503 TaxID=2508326 RepID=UPI00106F20D4|nr:hypothetical protein [Nocardioides sp. 503]